MSSSGCSEQSLHPLFYFCFINAKLKMHKNANSKCTILAKHRLEEYTPLRRCEYERAKGHFGEGEAFNEREFRNKGKLLKASTTA